jgi:hypothetical protein
VFVLHWDCMYVCDSMCTLFKYAEFVDMNFQVSDMYFSSI